jgi:hypothetical protein
MTHSTDRLEAVLLTGTLGSGKTSIAVEIAELVGEAGLGHAVIDLDWLAWARPAQGATGWTVDRVLEENLASVVCTFRSAGIRHLVMARALLSRSQLDLVRHALPKADVTVFRVLASAATVEERLRRRDSGVTLREHLEEALEFSAAMDAAGLEDERVDNDGGRPIRDVAVEVLKRLGWI